jgi:hypothetical protein
VKSQTLAEIGLVLTNSVVKEADVASADPATFKRQKMKVESALSLEIPKLKMEIPLC